MPVAVGAENYHLLKRDHVTSCLDYDVNGVDACLGLGAQIYFPRADIIFSLCVPLGFRDL